MTEGSWRVLKVLLTFAVLIAMWEASCRIFQIPSFLVPAPSEIVVKLFEKRDLFFTHTWVTTYETIAGFLLALVVGVVAAALVVVIPSMRDIVMPILLLAQIIPKVAIAPLLLIWFGHGLLSKVVIAFLVAFFPIVVSTASGLVSVERELLDLGRSLEASRWKIFWKFRIPSALPELFSGMKVALTLAITGAIIGEFIGGDKGLGYVMIVANQNLDTALGFSALLILSVLGLVLYGLIEMAERILIPWSPAVLNAEEKARP